MKILLQSAAFVLFIMIPMLFGQGYYPGGNYNPVIMLNQLLLFPIP